MPTTLDSDPGMGGDDCDALADAAGSWVTQLRSVVAAMRAAVSSQISSTRIFD